MGDLCPACIPASVTAGTLLDWEYTSGQMGRWTDTIGSTFSLSFHFTSLYKYTCHYRGL